MKIIRFNYQHLIENCMYDEYKDLPKRFFEIDIFLKE